MSLNRLKSVNYIDDQRGVGITAVRCKCCGETIKSLVANPATESTERVGEKVIVRHQAVLTELPNYREISINFENGGNHITPLCASCIHGLDVELLEEIYLADLNRWANQGMNIASLLERKIDAGNPFSLVEK